MGSKTLVLHPGSHVNVGVDAGIDSIIKGLNEVLTQDTPVHIALETMAERAARSAEASKSWRVSMMVSFTMTSCVSALIRVTRTMPDMMWQMISTA